MTVRYAVLNDQGQVENIIVLDPDTADEFAATSGLTIRPAEDGDMISTQNEPTPDKDPLANAAAILVEPLKATTVAGLRTEVDALLSRVAAALLGE